MPLGAMVIVALPVAWEWATSGLENGLSTRLAGRARARARRVVARVRVRRCRLPRSSAPALLIGLGPLIRPDLAVMSVCVLVALVVARRSARPRGRAARRRRGGAAPALRDLPCRATTGCSSRTPRSRRTRPEPTGRRAGTTSSTSSRPYWLWVPRDRDRGRGGVPGTRERSHPSLVTVVALPVAGVLHALYITKSGGDYLHGRLLLPSLVAIVAPFAAVPWRPKLAGPDRRGRCVGVARPHVAATRRTPGAGPGHRPRRGAGQGVDERSHRPGRDPMLATDFRFDDGPAAARLQRRGERALVAGPEPLLDVTPERTTLVSRASGISGYRAGPEVLVPRGEQPRRPRRQPPHAHAAEQARAPQAPGVGVAARARDTARHRAVHGREPRRDPTRGRGVRGRRDRSRRHRGCSTRLRCGDLAELVDATEQPLDAGRAWSNLTGAIGRTRLVVPTRSARGRARLLRLTRYRHAHRRRLQRRARAVAPQPG